MFNVKKISRLKINLASPDVIRSWSHGEVTSPETINYRSQKPEKDGLFCEVIFGPFKDFECHCGKYKKIRYQGLICEKCGVEIISKQVRRERFGHIELAAPCSHTWYLRGNFSNYIQVLLNSYAGGINSKELEEVVYFTAHVCLNPGTSKKLKKGQYINESLARSLFIDVINEFKNKFSKNSPEAEKAERYIESMKNENELFDYFAVSDFISKNNGAEFGEGAEAIKRLLHEINVEKEFQKTKEKLEKNSKKNFNEKLVKRLEVLNAFLTSKNKPEWMILDVIPVIPPDLRPMLPLESGIFAASDINNLYRCIIMRNNRLKRLIEINAPYVILINEKHMLQEAVDALFDNERNSRPVQTSNERPLKSLSGILKGKEGRLRQNLLGKRVDYSARSVITVGPNLKMYQCGIPREMAIELLRPFIISFLIKDNGFVSYKEANKLIEKKDVLVYDILEKIINDHPVLLNRAPTLHRLGIQAFQPKLVDGRAIQLHPLVCTGFNADFDGDQMAVHLPLSKKAQEESLDLMLANNNILDPKNGNSIVTPSQDMVLGNYYLTLEKSQSDFLKRAEKAKENNNNEEENKYKLFAASDGKIFAKVEDVLRAYETKQISLHNRIAILASALKKDVNIFDEDMQKMFLLTSVGRLIFNLIFPHDFQYLNDVSENYLNFDLRDANKKKCIMQDFAKTASEAKEKIEKKQLRQPFKKSDLAKIINQVFKRYGVSITSVILDKLKDQGFKFSTISGITISLSDIRVVENKDKIIAKGDSQIADIERMYDKGLLTDKEKHAKVIDVWNKVKAELILQLEKQLKEDKDNPLFIMVDSGARGSLSNFVQLEGMRGLMNKPNGDIIELPIKSNFREGMNVTEFFIATHGARKGGADTALKTANAGYLTRRLVDVSHDVIVRQEDCGVDHGFVMRAIKNVGEDKELVSLKDRIKGRYAVHDILNLNTGEIIVHSNDLISDNDASNIENLGIKEVEIRSVLTCQAMNGVCARCYGRNLASNEKIKVGDAVGVMAAQSIGEPGTQLTMRTFHTGGVAEHDITQGLPRIQELVEVRTPKGEAIISDIKGTVTKVKNQDGCFHVEITNKLETKEYVTDFGVNLLVKVGDNVVNGQKITQGVINPRRLLGVSDIVEVENYLLNEIHKPYCAQGIEINDKHIEIIIRKMLSKVLIIDSGDTDLLLGTHVDINTYIESNRLSFLNGKKPAVARQLILGIKNVALDSRSFLSAASFQETSRILANAAVNNKIDNLIGLKENVIVGKLIPVGTGLFTEKKEEDIVENFSVKKKIEEIEKRYANEF